MLRTGCTGCRGRDWRWNYRHSDSDLNCFRSYFLIADKGGLKEVKTMAFGAGGPGTGIGAGIAVVVVIILLLIALGIVF